MSKKFNPKLFQGDRIYRAVSGNQGINKLWIWNVLTHSYEPPERGCPYLAKKRVSILGKTKRCTQTFASLAAAQGWMRNGSLQNEIYQAIEAKPGVKFKDVFARWLNSDFKNLRRSSQVFYLKRVKHIEYFFEIRMSELTSQAIDAWLTALKEQKWKATRNSFEKEINFLKVILNYHREYSDGYVSPIKKRHMKAGIIKETPTKNKNISEDEFKLFIAEIRQQRHGNLFANLATLQYFQVLRISEAAAVSWSDIQFNSVDKRESEITIRKSVKWVREKGIKPFIEENIKNSKTLVNGCKQQPLSPQAYKALMDFKSDATTSGLVFCIDGEVLDYRAIQNAYDKAFEKAGLVYRGTHILRHGGCRRSFNKHGDLSIAQQQLGNKSMASVLVYAVREESAFYKEAAKEWDLHEQN